MKTKLMMAMVAAGAILAARAATEIVDGVTWSYSVSNGKATISSGTTPCVGEMTVPDTLGGCPVTRIGYGAFREKNEISKLNLPAGITSIEGYAFYLCTALTEINIPDGVMSIKERAFYSCSSLQQIDLPDTVTSLEPYAFYSCSALESVRLSANLTAIPEYCFYSCSKLAKIEIPAKVTSIGKCAFCACTAATTLSLPVGLMSIGSQAFYQCRGLKTLSIPAGVVVAENAFVECCNLKKIEVAEGNTSVKVVDGCLVSCSGTALMAAPSGNEYVKIPEGIVTIPAYMFSEAKSLKEVALPSTLQSIGVRAFYNSTLMKIEFPAGFSSFASITSSSVFEGAFYGCSQLKQVVFNGPPPANVDKSYALNYGQLSYPREYGAEWQKIVSLAKFNGYVQPNRPVVEYVSVAVRKADSTVLDVTYRVKSAKPTVKVRALAFKDGVRSFANVVRPTEFIEGTAANIGDAIAANAEHKLSWKVSADWQMDLTKFKFEVLAVEEDILPLELVKIPANGNNKPLEFSWNAITEPQVFDALLWLYADGDAGLTLVNGALKNGSTQLANGAELFGSGSRTYVNGVYVYSTYPAMPYVFSKMGFSQLLGTTLNYVNDATRLGLSPSGVMQYAWRELAE